MKGALSWVAVRNGRRYCSPACGGGCTFSQYRLAVERSDRVARRLGSGWQPRVWENLGWHWTVELKMQRGGRVHVGPSLGGGYTALVGAMAHGSGRTPREALRVAEAQLTSQMAPQLESLGALRRALGR